ncbi:MAG: T9SS type A sorting domain-containing protein, partial [Bacteroidales bacterium]
RLAAWQGISALTQDSLQLVLTGDVQIQAVFEPSDEFPGDEMNPVAFRLSQGDYHFSYWDPNEPEGSFPDHMIFQQTDSDDPMLSDPMTKPYQVPYLEVHDDDMAHVGYPYRLSRRTRINGLGQQGIAFINTGRGRDLGAAVLALDTRGASGIHVTWTGGTIEPNSRVYAIRLQVRVGREGLFQDVLDPSGNPVEYLRSDQEDHAAVFSTVPLPAEVENQPYVLLRWKYYFTGEQLTQESGARDMLRLDDIRVFQSATNVGAVPEVIPSDRLMQNVPNPFSGNTRIDYLLNAPGPVMITIHDQRGILVNTLVDATLESGRHSVLFHSRELPAGVYFYRMKTARQIITKRMMIFR